MRIAASREAHESGHACIHPWLELLHPPPLPPLLANQTADPGYVEIAQTMYNTLSKVIEERGWPAPRHEPGLLYPENLPEGTRHQFKDLAKAAKHGKHASKKHNA